MAVYPIASTRSGGVMYSDKSVKNTSSRNAIGTGTGGYPVYSSQPISSAPNVQGVSDYRPSTSNSSSQSYTNYAGYDVPTGTNPDTYYVNGKKLSDIMRDQQSEESRVNSQIDEAYNPAYQNLNLMEQQYRQEYPTAQAALDAENTQAQNELQNKQNTELAGISSQRKAAASSKQTQIQKARRLASELKQGNLVRFGGSSSTADASSEILNRGTQEQFGNIEQNFGDLEQKLTQEEANINTFYVNKKSELEDKKRLAEKQLKDQFDAKIREINRGRNELDSAKAGKRLAALQELSASYRQIQADASQFAQELDAWKQFKDEALTNARNFNAKSFTIPGFKNMFGSYTINRQAGGGGIDAATGYYNPDVQDEIANSGLVPTGISVNPKGQVTRTFGADKQSEEEKLINALSGY